MIRHYVNSQGNEVFAGKLPDLRAACEWAKSFMHLVYGQELGERMYRQLPVKRVLSLWAWRVPGGEA